jgi:hypothetical protein
MVFKAKTSGGGGGGGTDRDNEAAEIFKTRVEQIIEISKLKIKSKPSITNKTIFKHLDMLDEISGKSKK